MAKGNAFGKTLTGLEADKEKEKAIAAVTGQPEQPEDELVPFNLRIEKPLKAGFQETCERMGHTMTWVIKKAMKDYIKANREE